jgi:hypothetical protein
VRSPTNEKPGARPGVLGAQLARAYAARRLRLAVNAQHKERLQSRLELGKQPPISEGGFGSCAVIVVRPIPLQTP